MTLYVVGDFDMMGPLGRTCPCSYSLLQRTHHQCWEREDTAKCQGKMAHPGLSNTKHQGVGMCVERSKEGILLLTFM